MKRLSTIIISGIAVLQAGCFNPTSYSKLKPQLEQWQNEQQYGRSLDALAQIDPKDPEYQDAADMRKHIEKEAAEYELQVRRLTVKQLRQGEWAAALDQYDDALEKYPQSPVLRDGLAKLHQQQRDELEQLERKRLMTHGEWLQEIIPVYKDIARTNPRSGNAQSRLNRILDEAAEVSRSLAIVGSRSLADDELDDADATLTLADALHSDPVVQESIKVLRAKQTAEAKQRRAARAQQAKRAQAKRQKRERAIDRHLQRYNLAFAKKDFLTARVELAKIEKLEPKYPKLTTMRQELQKAVDNRVSRIFEAGVSAYSRGQYERATKHWREVLELDPDHQQARESLERAEKVLEKIERLKQKQEG